MRQARLIASLLNNNSLSYLPPVAVFSSRAPLCRSKGPREHHSDKKARCRALGVPAQRMEPVGSGLKECRGRPITYQCA
jgi:hypothetical protein